MLASDLISATESHLMSGDRDELNALANTIANTDTSITITYEMNGVQPGSYLCIDLEILYVWSTDETNKTALVQRGMVGSVPDAHTAGSVIYVNPKVSKFDIFNALNAQINDMSIPPGGLFQAKQFQLVTQPVQETYTIPALNADLIDILEIRYQPPGPSLEWPRIRRNDFQILRNMPLTGDGGFTTGLGLRIDPQLYPGRPMNVTYMAGFSPITHLDDDVAAVTGIPVSALDIPPLGAAYRLITVREAKRSFAEAAVDSRRANEVPSGSAARAGGAIYNLLKQRMKSEYLTLVAVYPETR